MLYPKEQLQTTAQSILKGRSPAQFLRAAAIEAGRMFAKRPSLWTCLGPYWPGIQRIIQTYGDADIVDSWNHGQPAPDFLHAYDMGDDLLNWCAGMTYFNKDGDYMAIAQPHSIELPNGESKLYMPGVGLLETQDNAEI